MRGGRINAEAQKQTHFIEENQGFSRKPFDPMTPDVLRRMVRNLTAAAASKSAKTNPLRGLACILRATIDIVSVVLTDAESISANIRAYSIALGGGPLPYEP
jgi:hypothetical protein